MVALALSASSMMLKAPPPDVVQHFVHVPVRRRGTPVSAVSVATSADVDDGQSNRICRRPALRTRAGAGERLACSRPDGRSGGSAHRRTERVRVALLPTPRGDLAVGGAGRYDEQGPSSGVSRTTGISRSVCCA